MKKFFTLICALVGLTANVSAATIDDVSVCKHSYVLVMDEWNNNGAAKPGKGSLIGSGFFLDVTGGSVATNKKSINLADETFADGRYFKYAEYGSHLNSWRLKNGQDVVAMKVTQGSKVIILGEAHASRYPQINDAAPSGNSMQGNNLGYSLNTVSENGCFEWVADQDRTIYIGSYNGDYFISYIIVEANEAPGTPMVKVSEQKFDNGVFFREVTCTPTLFEMGGAGMETVVTYTLDGSEPTEDSDIYGGPILCYENQVVKFQAWVDLGFLLKCENADNEGIVEFSFDAPTISFDETSKTATLNSAYAEQGATVEYYSSYDDVKDKQGQSVELSSSTTLTAYVKIINGDYGTFTSNTSTQDIYILDALKEKTILQVTGGTAVRDAEASAAAGESVYVIEGGSNNAKSNEFFIKDLEYAAIPSIVADQAEYQVPAGQEAYIKMNTTNITFKLDGMAGVVVTCSKNSCKNMETDPQCMVNVDGTNYGSQNVSEEYVFETDENDDPISMLPGNIIKFDLEAGTHTFKKYSGTGNILISSIEITPGESVFTGVAGVVAADEAASAKAVKAVKNGRLVIVNGNSEYSVSGAQLK